MLHSKFMMPTSKMLVHQESNHNFKKKKKVIKQLNASTKITCIFLLGVDGVDLLNEQLLLSP